MYQVPQHFTINNGHLLTQNISLYSMTVFQGIQFEATVYTEYSMHTVFSMAPHSASAYRLRASVGAPTRAVTKIFMLIKAIMATQ